MDPDLIFDPLPSADLVRMVEENVIEHTVHITNSLEWLPVNYFLKSPTGDWLGGCLGMLWGGVLHIRFLWVTERQRGEGLGGRLLKAAETHAMENGGRQVLLDTFSPDALAFYQRHGYAVFGALADYPPGFSKFFLRKSLTA